MSHPEICCGDHHCASLSSTNFRSSVFAANLAVFGRRTRCHAARSAPSARWRPRPPLRVTSRHTVDAARPRRPAIDRNHSPAATPREISSRSVNAKHRLERRRGTGRTPPESSIIVRTDDDSRPKRRAIDRIASPPCHRSHTSALSDSENLRTTTSPDKKHQLSPTGVASTPRDHNRYACLRTGRAIACFRQCGASRVASQTSGGRRVWNRVSSQEVPAPF